MTSQLPLPIGGTPRSKQVLRDQSVRDSELDHIAVQVREHQLVEGVLLEDREIMHVRAPSLHPDDGRLQVARRLE